MTYQIIDMTNQKHNDLDSYQNNIREAYVDFKSKFRKDQLDNPELHIWMVLNEQANLVGFFSARIDPMLQRRYVHYSFGGSTSEVAALAVPVIEAEIMGMYKRYKNLEVTTYPSDFCEPYVLKDMGYRCYPRHIHDNEYTKHLRGVLAGINYAA